jgi:acyl transferase domain-containing protein
VKGRCKTFSDKANGYVRGEGVGMLFLKRLKDAEVAGDNIYAVIKGTSENHGGRANSLTAPNPKAQAQLLVDAYTNAGIDPRTVTYIEAHGTGTSWETLLRSMALKWLSKSCMNPQVIPG